MVIHKMMGFLKKIPLRTKGNIRFINTSAINYKIVKFKLSDIGEGISEVEIIQWNKNVGDTIEEMESLLTVQSDKAAVDISSKYNGVLVKKYKNEKEFIKIGSYICEIDTEDVKEEEEESKEEKLKDEEDDNGSDEEHEDKLDTEQKYNDKVEEEEEVEQSGLINKQDDIYSQISVKASPGVRKKANEYGLDLNKVGTYFNKEVITINDLEAYRKRKDAGNESEKKEAMQIDVIEKVRKNETEEVILRGTRMAMCKSMNDSLTIPLFHLNDVFILTNLIKMKNDLQSIAQQHDIKITLTSILLKVISIALNEFPILNSTFNANKNAYTMYKSHNMCVAMDTPHGLLVPNIKNVEKKNIIEIQKDLNLLREKAMNNKLSKSDITNGTITLSNFGTISGSFAMPIIFDNQACIIGISQIQKQVLLKDEKKEFTSLNDLTVADTMNMTYGADHRFIDGATIAKFSKKLKMMVENPYRIFPFVK